MNWVDVTRPGYFGRKKDEKIAVLNETYGKDKWRMVWRFNGIDYDFAAACSCLYEGSYFRYLYDKPAELDFICSYGEVIDNAPSNITSGLDYTKQESFSTHIQDIAIRNVVFKLGRVFTGPKEKILVVRSKDSDGFRFGPGNVPFAVPAQIILPSLIPWWGKPGSVEDFWQSNKIIQVPG